MFLEIPCDINIDKLIREDTHKNPSIEEMLNPESLSGFRLNSNEIVRLISGTSYSNEFDAKERQEVVITLQSLNENEDFEEAIRIGTDYLKKDYNEKIHELVINAIWENGLSITDLNDLIAFFPDDFRNYTVRADANLVSFYIFGDYVLPDSEQDDGFSMEKKVSPKVWQAILDYEKAIELNPYDDYIYGMLAWAYWEKGDIDIAEKCYKVAIGISPDNPFGYHTMGYFYNYEGKTNEALLSYKKVLALDKHSKTVKESFRNIADKYYHKMQEKFSKHIPQSIDEIRFSSYQKIVKIYNKIGDEKHKKSADEYFKKLSLEFPGCKKKEKYKKYIKRIESETN